MFDKSAWTHYSVNQIISVLHYTYSLSAGVAYTVAGFVNSIFSIYVMPATLSYLWEFLKYE